MNKSAERNEEKADTVKPSFTEAFKFWLKLGFISFGGPAGQIAIMQRELVERKKWIDEHQFLHALNYCMLLPGPEAQQLATYGGWLLHGTRGGIVAGTLFVLPSVFLLLLLSYIYVKFGNIGWVTAILGGFKPIVVAIVVEAVIKIGKRAFKSWIHIAIAASAFMAIFLFHIPFPLIILSAALIGILALKPNETDLNTDKNEMPRPISRFYVLNVLIVCLLLWLVPFLGMFLMLGANSFPVRIYLFFTQAAFVTFGGAYAVLGYINQAVVGAGWVTPMQSVDGLALAETTPGPLIMVLQFVGFVTGWNHQDGLNQALNAVLCALLATFATFLPSFLFIFIGAPYIEKLRHNQFLTASLAAVTAAVVGVILNLALAFGSTVILKDSQINWFLLIAAILAFIALYRFKADVLLVIVSGGLLGLMKYFIFG